MDDKEFSRLLWQRLDKIENKVDKLMAFRYQILGGIILACFIVDFAFKFFDT